MSSNPNYIRNVSRAMIPFGNRVQIDPNGVAYFPDSDEVVPKEIIDGVETIIISFLDKVKPHSISRMVAMAYMPPSVEVLEMDKLEVAHLDGNIHNHHPSNLCWILKDGPIETARALGFYRIPGYTKYIISKEGLVLDSRNLRPKNTILNNGILSYKLNRDWGKENNVSVARLLALAFIPTPLTSGDYVVRHKDGNKDNLAIDNLEWVLREEIVSQSDTQTNIRKGVVVRDVYTGNVIRFNSVRAMAKHFDIDKKSATHRLTGKEQRVYYPGIQLQYEDDLTEWRIPTDQEIERATVKKDTTKRAIVCKNISTGEIHTVFGAVEAGKLMNIYHRTVSADLSGETKHKPRNGWEFWYESKPSESV